MFFVQLGNLVFWVAFAPFFDRTETYELLLKCDGKYIYPFRFVIIFAIDLFYALIELTRVLRYPAFTTEKDRSTLANLSSMLAKEEIAR